MSGGRAVKLRLEPRHKALGRRSVRAGRSGWRHETAVKLPHNFLPGLGIGADVGEVHSVKSEAAREQLLVVAGHAILCDEGLLSRNLCDEGLLSRNGRRRC